MKGDDGKDYIIIRPALSNSVKTVIAGMSDVYGYSHQVRKGEMSVLTLRSTDGHIECGGRFKYISEEIPMNYQALVKALSDAIDKEAAEHDNKFVTDEKMQAVEEKVYDFDGLMKQFQELVNKIMATNQANAPKITAIVERYLGKGKKVSDCTQTQVEQIDLIVEELKSLLG